VVAGSGRRSGIWYLVSEVNIYSLELPLQSAETSVGDGLGIHFVEPLQM